MTAESVSDIANSRTGIIPNPEKDKKLWRDLVAYWILGLCNNYGYVVMLSAAHDIVESFHKTETHDPDTRNSLLNSTDSIYATNLKSFRSEGEARECNIISTGAILLADIIPALIIKFLAPFIPYYVNIRVFLCCGFAASGFLLVAFAENEVVAILGVITTSLSSGLGEATFLSYSTFFNKNVISTWSSGTGGAGIAGSLSYAGLIQLGLSPTVTMLIMLVSPVLEAIAFWIILRKPDTSKFKLTTHQPDVDVDADETSDTKNQSSSKDLVHNQEAQSPETQKLVGIREKFRYIPSLFKYMIPLTLVYLFEYFINQGLFELIYFPNIWLSLKDQYRWLQVDYQIGVFISRSSVNLVQFKHLWIMAVLQFVNVVLFLVEVFYFISPSIWIIFAIVFWEGLLGGGAYVNTFYRMSKEIPGARGKFAMSVVSMSDSVGIALAGIFAIPSHNAICGLPIPPNSR